jgi:hypothetical protein
VETEQKRSVKVVICYITAVEDAKEQVCITNYLTIDWKKHKEKCKKKEKDYELFKLRVHDPAKRCPIKLVHPKIVEQVKRLGGNFLEIACMDYKHSLGHDIRVQPWAQAVVNIQFPKNRMRLGSESMKLMISDGDSFAFRHKKQRRVPSYVKKI